MPSDKKSIRKFIIPRSQQWDRFWQLDRLHQRGRISWSKRRIMERIEPFVKKGGSALDAGCGSGFFAKHFCDHGMRTTAMDNSKNALVLTLEKTKGRAKVVETDLLCGDLMNQVNERFDLIFSDGLLEHFPAQDQDKIVKNFKTLLSPQGVLITFVPNRWSPWELIRPFYMPGIEEDPFTLNELVQLNVRNGLKVIEKGGVNTLPWVLSPDRFVGPVFGMLLYTIAKCPA